jgi:hypothetical protein
MRGSVHEIQNHGPATYLLGYARNWKQEAFEYRGAANLNPPSASSLPICDSGQEVPNLAELGDLKDAPDIYTGKHRFSDIV